MALEFLMEIIVGTVVEIGIDEYPKYAARRRNSAWRLLLTSFLVLLALFTILMLLPIGPERSWADRMHFVLVVSTIGAIGMTLAYGLYRWVAVREARKQARSEQAQAEQVQAEQVQAEQVQAEQVQAEQVQAEQVQAEQVQAEQVQAEQVQAEQVRAERAAGIVDRG